MDTGTIPFDAVVLAGGAATRLDGADKPALRVGDASLLDRVLTACADASATIVVGPRRATARPVVWTREDPPGGGPLSALAAGLDRVRQGVTVLLAADLPFLGPEVVRALLTGLAERDTTVDGAVLTDPGGRDQPLVAAYRTEPLRREIALLAAEHGTLGGLPMRLLVAGLALYREPDPASASFDCDTWDDVGAARARLAGGGPGATTQDGHRGA